VYETSSKAGFLLVGSSGLGAGMSFVGAGARSTGPSSVGGSAAVGATGGSSSGGASSGVAGAAGLAAALPSLAGSLSLLGAVTSPIFLKSFVGSSLRSTIYLSVPMRTVSGLRWKVSVTVPRPPVMLFTMGGARYLRACFVTVMANRTLLPFLKRSVQVVVPAFFGLTIT